MKFFYTLQNHTTGRAVTMTLPEKLAFSWARFSQKRLRHGFCTLLVVMCLMELAYQYANNLVFDALSLVSGVALLTLLHMVLSLRLVYAFHLLNAAATE